MKKKTLLVVGAVAAVVFVLSKRKRGVAVSSRQRVAAPGMKPAKVNANEKVSAKTFSPLRKKRAGYIYVPAKMLPDGQIEFTSPKTGLFTRYVLQVGNRMFAEVA